METGDHFDPAQILPYLSPGSLLLMEGDVAMNSAEYTDWEEYVPQSMNNIDQWQERNTNPGGGHPAKPEETKANTSNGRRAGT